MDESVEVQLGREGLARTVLPSNKTPGCKTGDARGHTGRTLQAAHGVTTSGAHQGGGLTQPRAACCLLLRA